MLRLHGYWILARRADLGDGEIDIIARTGSTLVFVEVKARKVLDTALEAVSHRAQSRIAVAANLWVERNPQFAGFDRRFDIIAVIPGARPVHLKDAFWPGDWM